MYSQDYRKSQEALVCLKNAVIGSNKRKGSVISQGVVPKLTAFLKTDDVPLSIRLDAAIVIGTSNKYKKYLYICFI